MKNKGDILVSVLIFSAISVTILTGLVNWGATMLAGIRATAAKEQAFQIAEAGIDYYRWHLAQYPTDYQDGTNRAGPYNHNFYDKNGNLIGGYSLAITQPPLGSTKVVVTSTGTTTANKTVQRVVQAILAEPSLAQYAVVANDYMRFGSGTMVNGPVISNRGIHFNTGAVANNIVSSALATDTDPDSNNTEWGVWTDVDPSYNKSTTPPTLPQGVFLAGRQYPVPATSFSGLLVNLQQIETAANTDGYNFSQSTYTPSGHHQSPTSGLGYHMVLSSPSASYPNGYFTMYVVTALVSPPGNCGNDTTAKSETGWDTRSIQSEVLYTPSGHSDGKYAFPSNGVIFVQDDLWVDGQINGARLTIAAGFGANGLVPSITIGTVNNEDNGNLVYTDFNGNDTIGLIAQNNIDVPLESHDTITVDAALMAENGRVGRFYYSTSCTITDPAYPGNSSDQYYYNRSTINLDGMIATNQRYGFAYAYTDNSFAGGYMNRNITYDANLLYAPPPDFPLASTQYQMASWKQLQ